MIVIVDYGSQTTQLIARRIRELNVFSTIMAFDDPKLLKQKDKIDGIILSGGPSSVYADLSPFLPKEILTWNKPILGICYGAQLITKTLGGSVDASDKREFGRAKLSITHPSLLFKDVPSDSIAWMSHGDKVTKVPQGFIQTATTSSCTFAGFENPTKQIFGVQFHPEVTHTDAGKTILKNFVLEICKAPALWTMSHFIDQEVARIQKVVGDHTVICGLSGGVDSSVVATLLHKAIGSQLKAIFVDTGLLRKNEALQVKEAFAKEADFELTVVDAQKEFLSALAGVDDPETKRKIIGRVFVEVFEKQAKRFPNATFLAQGTLYPDVIESVSTRGPSVTIKSHHNVGGLPEKMNMKLIEPLRALFKDEVRVLGETLGLSHGFVQRHPFPGPGLAVRILGDVTPEKVTILQQADDIFISELKAWKLYDEVWQALTVLLPVQSVGVMGDGRTYENVCALRAVTSHDGMTADFATLPFDFLGHVSSRIINEVKGINRVTYDISSKPPATIEWE